MTTPNILRLTPNGERAINNASAGGIQIKPYTASIGNYVGEVPALVPDSLLGDAIHSGRIRYIQVLSEKLTRFTLEIPAEVEGVLGECLVSLEDATVAAHAVIQPPRVKESGKALRIELLLHVGEFSTDVISIELCEFSSIPTVARVEDLPSPIKAMESAIGVLDLNSNRDGSFSPNLAVRYGEGSQHWGFGGWNRIYSGEIGKSKVINNAEFHIPDALVGIISDGELVLQAVSGGSAGESRKAVCANGKIKCSVKGFTSLSGSETLNIWASNGGETVSSLPPRDSIPSDWVLTAGKATPVWSKPNAAGSNGQSAALYTPPSKLKINHFMQDGNNGISYDMGVAVENNNYLMNSLSGVTQHRNAFDIQSNIISYAEPITNELTIMGRAFTHEPSTGDFLTIKSASFVADGSKRKFKLPLDVTRQQDVIVFVEQMDQNYNAYTVDLDNQEVVFNSSPDAGYRVEVNAFTYEKKQGYSTNIDVFNVRTFETESIFELPIEPEDIDMVFVSMDGLHIHKSNLTLSGRRIAISSEIKEGISLEFMVFSNKLSLGSPASNLVGVATGLNRCNSGLELILHGAPSVVVPIDLINLTGDGRIKVQGAYPDYTISFVDEGDSETPAGTVLMAQTTSKNEESVGELNVPIRIDLNGNNVIVEATANFSAELGEGFYSETGVETFDAVCVLQQANAKEAAYGTRGKGTAVNTFSFLGTSSADEATAYSHISRTVCETIRADNHKAGYLNLVAKCKLSNVDIERYDTWLSAEISIKVTVV